MILSEVYMKLIHISTAIVDGVKNDHRGKFSNLSNWKEEAGKNQGFNGIRTRDLSEKPMRCCGFIAQLGLAEVRGSNPIEALIFFKPCLLKLEMLLR